MPTDYVQEVVKLAAPVNPTEQPSHQDWQTVESELGLEFPADYKALVSALGSGRFGDGLALRNPRASSGYIRLSRDALLEFQRLMTEAKWEVDVSLYPKTGGFVSIGHVDRHAFLLHPDQGGRLLDQIVWWDQDYKEIKDLGMSISRFIHDLYVGQIREEWAERLRQYFWRGGERPFYVR